MFFLWNSAGNDQLEAAVSLFIQSHLPEAVLVENLSSELIYQLPDDTASVRKFEQLFVDLDSRKTELGISGYGISNTSLEEVWMLCVQFRGSSTVTRLDAVCSDKSRKK